MLPCLPCSCGLCFYVRSTPVGATIGRPSTPVKEQQKQPENFFYEMRATGGRPYKKHVFLHYYCASYCPISVAEARVGRRSEPFHSSEKPFVRPSIFA